MVDAPEHIWAYARFDDDFNGGDWDALETPDCAPDWPHAKYRRADLPPTPAQAMQVPEVRELHYAATVLIEGFDAGYYRNSPAANDLRDALRRING